ncbi:MAG: hypothetical protein HOH43_09550 [Candidatus Latescibacteria bacterium]|nr:hypothetical protein [Gemmatimonadota bacterium]MBT5873652.1 hypothetical protein [Candidatus Latescibacterota bacterium]
MQPLASSNQENQALQHEYQEQLRSSGSVSRRHCWVVAAPKSGSTWLTWLLEQCLGWPKAVLLPCYERREQEIDLRMLDSHAEKADLITPNQHCRFSLATEAFIGRPGVKVILQVRDLFDMLASKIDHIEREGPLFPMAYMDMESWHQLEHSARTDFIIDMIAPWYFNFYVSWMKSGFVGTDRVLLVEYGKLTGQPATTLAEVFAFLDVSVERQQIDKALLDSKTYRDGTDADYYVTRFNRGTPGRGPEVFSKAQVERVKSFAAYYPGVDFGPLGL